MTTPSADTVAGEELEVRLTDDEIELHVCCLKRRLCTEDHFHARDVERIIAARVEQARAGEGALRERVEALHVRRDDPIVAYDCLEGDCDHADENYDGDWPSPACPRLADAVCAHCADQTRPDEAWEHMVRPDAFWPCATIRALADTAGDPS